MTIVSFEVVIKYCYNSNNFTNFYTDSNPKYYKYRLKVLYYFYLCRIVN